MTVGRIAALASPKHATEYCGVSRNVANYWKKKYLDPTWKRERHGGKRRGFSDEQLEAICGLMRTIVDSNPATPYAHYKQRILEELNINVSTTWISQTFQDVGWTYARLFIDATRFGFANPLSLLQVESS